MNPALRRVRAGGRRGEVRSLVTNVLPGTVAAAMRAGGARTWLLDTSAVADKAAFLRTCADVFAFPAWFGHNWDALVDCLREVDHGVVVWGGAHALAARDHDTYTTAHEILADTAAAAVDLTVLLVAPVPFAGIAPA